MLNTGRSTDRNVVLNGSTFYLKEYCSAKNSISSRVNVPDRVGSNFRHFTENVMEFFTSFFYHFIGACDILKSLRLPLFFFFFFVFIYYKTPTKKRLPTFGSFLHVNLFKNSKITSNRKLEHIQMNGFYDKDTIIF